MRISDWSSDVCSSDLQALVWVDVQGLQPGQASAVYAYYGNEKATAGQDVAGTFGPDYKLVWHFNADGVPRDATANGSNAVDEIGRASCRERVCQDVEI